MPHYKSGQEVKLGDLIVCQSNLGSGNIAHTVGILATVVPTASTCNGTMVPVASRTIGDLGFGPWIPLSGTATIVTLADCLQIDPVSLFIEFNAKVAENLPVGTGG